MAELSGIGAGVTATAQVQKVFGGAVGGVAAGATQGPAGNASWEFDPDEIGSVISKWEALLDDVKGDQLAINDMVGTAFPPSRDDPSGKFVQDLRDGLLSLLESNQSILAYIEDFLGKLKAAKGGIEATEVDNADPFRAAGGLLNT